MQRYSNLISLIFLSVACIVSVTQYKKDNNIQFKLAQLDAQKWGGPMALHSDDEGEEDTEDHSDLAISHPDSASGPAQPQLVNGIQSRTLQISKGDTFVSLLTEVGFSKAEVDLIFASAKKECDVRKMKIGQALVVSYKPATENASLQFVNLEFNINDAKALLIKRTDQGDYKATVEMLKFEPVLKRVHGRVHSSFYSTAVKNGVPKKIVKQAIENLAYVMNFQHGIKRGDSFEILYDEHVGRNNTKVGDIRYVGFMAGNTYHRIYRMNHKGHVRYYDAKGQSIARGLLQTPLEARKVRITSGFSHNRLHPILGYCRAHKGVDFGAPTGTAIKAAGDGVIVKKGYYGQYGNYIKIRHGNGYETAYGHLSRYANIKVGSKVTQNQVIGYVGATGTATGPHLHYEVIKHGKHINPMKVQGMPSVKLVGRDLQTFNALKRDLDTHLVGLTPAKGALTNVALKDSVSSAVVAQGKNALAFLG